MPNFWTQTTQKIYEAFNGPRTTDNEFEKKINELNDIIKFMTLARQTISNFPKRTQGIQTTCNEAYTIFLKCYQDNIIYTPFIRDVCEAHKNVEKAYLSCCKSLNSLQNKTGLWDKLFTEVKENLEKRKAAREVYDHYDQKMEKLVKERNVRAEKRQNESSKEIDKFNRNDEKYKNAANDLIKKSKHTYKLMQDLLDYRYKLLNPLLVSFVSEEKIFFDKCSQFFRNFEGIQQKISELEQEFRNTPINYDPMSNIRAKNLLIGEKTDSPPQVVKNENNIYEDNKKKKNNNNQNFQYAPTYNPGRNIIDFDAIPNHFSTSNDNNQSENQQNSDETEDPFAGIEKSRGGRRNSFSYSFKKKKNSDDNPPSSTIRNQDNLYQNSQIQQNYITYTKQSVNNSNFGLNDTLTNPYLAIPYDSKDIDINSKGPNQFVITLTGAKNDAPLFK